MELPKRKSIRLPNYDYSQNGYYFGTICTHERKNLFAQIQNDEIIYNDYGKIALYEIEKTKFLREKNGISIDNYVVMPNHVHILIKIIKENVGTWRAMSAIGGKREFSKPISQSISSIVGAYKSAVTKKINKLQSGHGSPCP